MNSKRMHTPLPLFSIIIPVYNQQLPFLKQAVESAINQTYQNIEVIISDNHSTNEVNTYLRTLDIPHLRIVKPPEFLPMVQHFQFATDQAKGEYISLLCSDDWVYPNFIKTLAEQLSIYPQASIAYCKIENVDFQNINKVRLYTNQKKSGFFSAAESFNGLLNSKSFFAWIPGGIMKRSAYEQSRALLNGDISYAFDVALLFKMHEYGDVIYVDKPLAKFRIWSEDEGKVGGNRLLSFVNDFIKIKYMIKSSHTLSSYADDNDLKMWLKKQSGHWLLFLTIGLINSRITYENYKFGVNTIASRLYSLSITSQVIYFFFKKPFIYITKPLGLAAFKIFIYIQYKVNRITS